MTEEEMKAKEEEERKYQMEQWINKQVEMANRIFSEVKKSFKTKEFLELDDKERLKYYQNRFSNFNRQHPLSIRYMVAMLSYSPKAFTKYIKKVATSKVGDPDEYLQRQADYATLLWKENTTHWTQKGARRVWEEAYKLVKQESDTFKDMQDTAENIADKITSKFSQEEKEELNAIIEQIKESGKSIEEFIEKPMREQLMDEYFQKIKDDPNYESSDEEEPDFGEPTEGWTFFNQETMNDTISDAV